MKRRKFIKGSAILGGMAIIPFSCSPSTNKTKYKMGYQLYSIRDEMAKQPVKTLKALKAMGYQDFEVYGFDAENGKYYGFESSEFKQILDDLELTVTFKTFCR